MSTGQHRQHTDGRRTIVVFSGIPPFQSKSMDLYAEKLLRHLESTGERVVDEKLRAPRWFSWVRPHSAGQFLLRYGAYPLVALAAGRRHGREAIYYVTDNASAWLLCFLPRQATKIATVHDLAAFKPPADFLHERGAEGRLIRLLATLFKKPGLLRADALIAVSAFTGSELERYLGIPSQSITVAPNGVEHALFSPGDKAAARRALGLDPERPIVMTIASLRPRKNVRLLLDAIALLEEARGRSVQLLYIGSLPRSDRQRIERQGLSSRVKVLPAVSVEGLRLCYQAADVYAIASLYEGFGLPVLEAMACGCPVVYLDVAAVPEVAGNAGLGVGDATPSAFATAVGRVLEDEALASTLSQRGIERAAQYSWERCARTVHAVLTGASDHRAGD